MNSEIVINDSNYTQFVDEPTNLENEDGIIEFKSRGLIERDYSANPVGSGYAKAFDLPVIPKDQWEGMLRNRIESKAQLSDLRNRAMSGKPAPSTDQNGKGYCWAHSSTSAILLCRMIENQKYVRLSATSVAATIKKYVDQGGYGEQSLKFIGERGIASHEFWPEKSMDRALINDPKVWENAKLHRFTDWLDLKPRNKEQFVTCLLLGIPVVSDFNWWGHSVCTMELVSLDPFRTRIWNSWSDKWSSNGTGILEGSKAIPDGMNAPLLSTISHK